nr:hypothetical protein [Corynebacterium lactis]
MRWEIGAGFVAIYLLAWFLIPSAEYTLVGSADQSIDGVKSAQRATTNNASEAKNRQIDHTDANS